MIETRYGPTELEAVHGNQVVGAPKFEIFTDCTETTDYYEQCHRSFYCFASFVLMTDKLLNNMVPKSFMYDGAYIWNYIPKEIQRESKSLSFERKSLLTLIDIAIGKYRSTCK
jgi:hypothetical protein